MCKFLRPDGAAVENPPHMIGDPSTTSPEAEVSGMGKLGKVHVVSSLPKFKISELSTPFQVGESQGV